MRVLLKKEDVSENIIFAKAVFSCKKSNTKKKKACCFRK